MTAEEELSGSPAEELHEKVIPELKVLRGRIQEVMQSDKRVGLPCLRSCDRAEVERRSWKGQ